MENTTLSYLEKEGRVLKNEVMKKNIYVFLRTFLLMMLIIGGLFYALLFQEEVNTRVHILAVKISVCFSLIIGVLIALSGEHKAKLYVTHPYEKEMVNLYDFIKISETRKNDKRGKKKVSDEELLEGINKEFTHQKLKYLMEALKKSETMSDYEMKKEVLENDFKNKTLTIETKYIMGIFMNR